jgi:hypothetical protein
MKDAGLLLLPLMAIFRVVLKNRKNPMNPVDLTVFVLYFIIILGIGVYFYFRNKGAEEYYIGGRKMGYRHVGLSVVATDVGGGFPSVWADWASSWGYPARGCFSPGCWAPGWQLSF